ncbi:MAG: amino acid permease [Frankiales bacterium]|nr:amino acid permease [Frankiales bacterium]
MDQQQHSVDGVTYQHAGHEYFAKRQLTRHAGAFALWGLGVAAVISGDFSGWNFGIAEAGWGGMVVATIVIGLMYLFMVYSIAEMSASMPHTGGAYSFARTAMGPWGGYVTGVAESIEYVFTTAVVGVFASSYADAIVSDLWGISWPLWVWMLIFYVIFVGLNTAGAAASFRFAITIAILSLLVLAIFFVTALFSGKLSTDALFDIAPTSGNTTFMPFGVGGVMLALPFAIWFFLGIEELPLAAEETHTPQEDIPRGSVAGLFTLFVTAALVLVLNPMVMGSETIGGSLEPILDGFRVIFPNSSIAAVLSLAALTGLIASFQGIMFAAGRNVYSLSRAGYYPRFLSLTGARKTPYVALLFTALVGMVAVVVVPKVFNQDDVNFAGSLLNMAVFGAVIAYVLQMVTFVLLRIRRPEMERPYRSPSGTWGAAVAGVVAAVTLVILFFNEGYRAPIVAIAVFFAVALIWFAAYGRTRLVLSPEEEFAVTGGKHGHPETEGYAVTEDEEDSGQAEYFPPVS